MSTYYYNKAKRQCLAAACLLSAALCIGGCSTIRKARILKAKQTVATLSLPKEDRYPAPKEDFPKRDTLVVKGEDGRDILIMKAMRSESGEMVATDVISAAVVTARFRNVAERSGKVDISFDVTVPRSMQDSKWQLRLQPDMHIAGKVVALDPVVITGDGFRKVQLRGYQHYQRFLSRIITDTTKLIDMHQLEVFIRRNLPQVYSFKNDTSFVSDENFASAFGVTGGMAEKHYTIGYLVRRNGRLMAKRDRMFKRFVRTPIETEGLRLDTVLRNPNQDFVYRYTQTVTARPSLKKVGVDLGGLIYEHDRKIYEIPRSDMLTFYISSLSSFVDNCDKYMTKVVERRVEESSTCQLDFDKGDWKVDPAKGDNFREIDRIKGNLSSLMENVQFDLDSIVVTATCSPEGGFRFNEGLSRKRGESVCGYFENFMKRWRDSTASQAGFVATLGGEMAKRSDPAPIRFTSRAMAQNWDGLDTLVEKDTTLTLSQKESYRRIRAVGDPDVTENLLQKEDYYPYLRNELYPRLRTVSFDFHLHRKGMVKDTVHTSVKDTTYQRGVQALRDMDYETAVNVLRPYRDYNTAVAYCATERNSSALDILRTLESSDKVDYLMAILLSRQGDERGAVEKYMSACRMNQSMVSRGNLDPEISHLIRKYGLNQDR